MQYVLRALAFVVYFFAAVAAEMLLAIFAKYCFGRLRGLLALLAYELNFILVAHVRGVADGASDALAGQAPERALGLLFALLALDGHVGVLVCVFVFIYIYIYSAISLQARQYYTRA